MVYYRKYRPQTIEELDSTKVRETLTSILRHAVEDRSNSTTTLVKQANSVASAPSVPHAFLFTGPKGLGKTSTARIIAKVINCTTSVKDRKNGFEPCGKCDACISITNGSNIDVLEIDGASNRGIDEIRDLRDKVKLAPSNAKKKVYIIDEVHMLTTEAFNALLKTIEEPPEHVMFMFATTEPQKVPATILSRCFHVAFPRATEEDIVHSLERIVKGEDLIIEKEALEEIAKMADGGFRDGAKILEEIVALSEGKKITKEFFEEKYKVSSSSHFVSSMLQALSGKNINESLEIIGKVIEQGTDVKYFVGLLLEGLHEMLLAQNGIVENTKYSPRGEAGQIPNTKYSLNDIKYLSDLFFQAYQQIKFSPIPQLPLELAVIEWCSQTNQKDVILGSEVTPESSDSAGSPHKGDYSQIKSGMTSNNGPTIAEVRKKEQTLKFKTIIEGTPSKAKEPVLDQNTHKQNSLHDHKDNNTQLMENIIYKVKPYNNSLAGVLRGCDIASLTDEELILRTAYKFHQERLQDMKSIEVLEQVVREITGKQIKVLVELKG